jgi:hypothetical protein
MLRRKKGNHTQLTTGGRSLFLLYSAKLRAYERNAHEVLKQSKEERTRNFLESFQVGFWLVSGWFLVFPISHMLHRFTDG